MTRGGERTGAGSASRGSPAPRPTSRKQPAGAPDLSDGVARTIARRRYNAEPIEAAAVAAEAELGLTDTQMREARRILRHKQQVVRKEREFGRRLVATLTEGQNALNIGFGAILSAYIGNVLAAIDTKPFNQWTLAGFFVLVGVFIGGLCIGNLVVLRRHFGLGLCFLVTGGVAAAFSLDTARALGFELPILKVMYICWYAMLIATDAILTAIVFFHHRSVVARERQLDSGQSSETEK